MPVRFHPVIVFLALIVLCQANAQAQSTPDFPDLTGRVMGRLGYMRSLMPRRTSHQFTG